MKYPTTEFIEGKRIYIKYVSGTAGSSSSDEKTLATNVSMIVDDKNFTNIAYFSRPYKGFIKYSKI